LVKEIEGLRDQLIAQVDKMVDDLLPPADTFDGVATRLAAMKPSRLLAPLIEDLKPLTDLLAKLDPSTLMQPLIDAIARVKDEVPHRLTGWRPPLTMSLLPSRMVVATARRCRSATEIWRAKHGD